MKNVPVVRTIACVIAGILLVTGLGFLFEEYQIHKDNELLSQILPLDMPVDLSKPGEFSAPFRQTMQGCHAQIISLRIPTNVVSESSSSNLLASLNFNWQITDADGAVVVKGVASGSSLHLNRRNGDESPLIFFRAFAYGDCIFHCRVVTGAPALAGVDQRLVSYYKLCGIEIVPAVKARAIGLVSLIFAGIILLVVVVLLKRKRKR